MRHAIPLGGTLAGSVIIGNETTEDMSIEVVNWQFHSIDVLDYNQFERWWLPRSMFSLGEELHMTTAAELKTRVESLHEELYALAKTLPQETWHWKPEEQVWSIAQILGHIAEFEGYFTKVVERLSQEPGSKFGRPRDHETRMSGVTMTGDETVPNLLAKIEGSKQTVLSLLSRLSEDDWQKEGVSEAYGSQTLGWILEHFIADHLQKHIGQIRRNLNEYQAV